MPHEWDASTYDELPLPHVEWGRRVIDRMQLASDAYVLDAGCGTGRDLAALLDRHPSVTAVGVDASSQMLDRAAEVLAPYGERVTLRRGDLTEPIPVGRPVDAVMSVAAFHWITDHDLLFRRLADAMAPGARLTSDCGGAGNISNVSAGLIAVTGQPFSEKAFKGVDETRKSLEAAGFEVERVELRDDPLLIDDPELRALYLATIALGAHLTRVPEGEQRAFVEAVRDAMPDPIIDYVRLEIDAVAPARALG